MTPEERAELGEFIADSHAHQERLHEKLTRAKAAEIEAAERVDYLRTPAALRNIGRNVPGGLHQGVTAENAELMHLPRPDEIAAAIDTATDDHVGQEHIVVHRNLLEYIAGLLSGRAPVARRPGRPALTASEIVQNYGEARDLAEAVITKRRELEAARSVAPLREALECVGKERHISPETLRTILRRGPHSGLPAWAGDSWKGMVEMMGLDDDEPEPP